MSLFLDLPVTDLCYNLRVGAPQPKMLISYSGHFRSFPRMFDNHRDFFNIENDYGSNLVLHTWNEFYPQTKSWRGFEKTLSHEYSDENIEVYIKNQINPRSYEISVQYPDTAHLNDGLSSSSTIESMAYGLRFFSYSRFKSIKLAANSARQLNLSDDFPVAILRPDIKFKLNQSFKEYSHESRNNPVYFFNYSEGLDKAVDCVLFCCVRDLFVIEELISATPWRLLLQKVGAKKSDHGQYNDYWNIFR